MADVLPDTLEPGLRVVFCGTAAGTASAQAGAYYAGPGNAFWATLYSIGLTQVQLAPTEFARLPEYGIGLTDLCKVLHGSDQEVGTVEFDVDGLRARIAEAEPANLAFNGKNPACGALERGVDYGLQPERIGGADVWVLPSTSGAARRFWDIEPWHELARRAESEDRGREPREGKHRGAARALATGPGRASPTRHHSHDQRADRRLCRVAGAAGRQRRA